MKFACPHCGHEVSRATMLCPGCRAPLTGPDAKAPVPVSQAPPREEVARPNRAAPPSATAEGRAFVKPPPIPADFFDYDEIPPGRPVTPPLAGAGGAAWRWLARSLKPPTGPRARRTYWIKVGTAIVTLAVGLPLLVRNFTANPLSSLGGQVSTLPAKPASAVLSPIEQKISAVPGGPEGRANASGGAITVEARAVLLSAADQLDRFAPFLVSEVTPLLIPPPASPDQLMPPLTAEQEELLRGAKSSSPEAARLEDERIALYQAVSERLVKAREAKLMHERAKRVAAVLRSEAAAVDGKATPAPPDPALVPSDQEIDETLTILLGPQDASVVDRARPKAVNP